ncbi:Lar family restriction alleviation protein [Achromobacter xylosoxidans]|uniref:Restriction alleviation protein, Lar family n=1 Tax=Alcaligenes xylosoxydans xylosoxydans TaxID=85698 RepID=A0A424W551_ALCXX|nr:Lar family restriction alleviation protein [Achromobacter xylosoxidans]MBC9904800.1 Lar family restriction alleviation protein [Achromobacter xylosoxidans]MBD0868717.1 Lar family restriction alleviation protein [Achromobacter xylosoxidans]QNP87781.1 Lar family restriction alleviation protein [Achromobacter xylosoxidans]RPJ88442.1 hypothetical protein DY367_27945 [Achromobacter xylosoxidans]
MTTLPAGWKPRLSCPFCGSTCLFTVPDEHGSGGQWVPPIHVGCNDCQAEQVADTEDEAVERWNRRSSPASVAPGDAQAVAWMDPETLDVISAERKASWLSNYGIGGANKAARYTRALGDFRPAPAAGDARDAERLDWLQQHDGRFFNKDRISSIVGVGFLVAGDPQGVRHQTVRSAIDAARAASQQQEG